jgi:hypothetical protein
MRALIATLVLLLSAAHAAAQSAKDFTDGLGYYVFHGGKYQVLVWMTNLGTAFVNALAENPGQAASIGSPVKRDARILSFGLDISRAVGLTPPHFTLGYCYFTPGADKRTADKILHGTFPIRVKMINAPSGIFASRDDQLPIYELLLPDFTKDQNFGKPGPLLWALNLQNNCERGWLFRYE